jgi:homoserine acetyltransferase
MEIIFINKRQRDIAELMWAAETLPEVHQIVSKFGHDGHVVYNMIVAAALDESVMKEESFPQVDEIIKKFML